MEMIKVAPLVVETAMSGEIEFKPVQLADPMPSETPDLWLRFLKREGKRIPLSPLTANKCQRYMRQHNTEALSANGIEAFTIAGNALIECLPEVCGSPVQGESIHT